MTENALDLTHAARPLAMAVLGIGLLALAAVIYVAVPRSSPEPVVPLTAAAASSPVALVDGVVVVTVNAATQRQSGIASQPLAAASRRTETTAYGSVLDLQPLTDLHARHQAAQADAAAAAAAVRASRAEFERNRVLYADDRNVSLKAYQAAEAAYRADQAKADAAALNLQNMEGAAQQQFGQPLARWALDAHSADFQRLLARREVLARVTLPAGGAASAPAAIDVQVPAGARLPAHLVSAAARSDPGIAGSSYIYRVPGSIATGTALLAFLPTSTQATAGVFVPAAAVVWYAGQPWVYVQRGATRFARRPLGQAAEADGGFFVAGGLRPGEPVVTRGTQLLLSQEQRPPPAGAACKDPECD